MNNDQQIMENLLLTTKGVCDLYLHGAIESATPNVHQRLTARWAKAWICSPIFMPKCPNAAGIKTSRLTPSKSLRFGRNFG